MSTEEKISISVCPASEFGPGERRIVEHEGEPIAVFNCDGALLAIEDRCSHDDGPLAEGEWNPGECTVECPRHGSIFDLRNDDALQNLLDDSGEESFVMINAEAPPFDDIRARQAL